MGAGLTNVKGYINLTLQFGHNDGVARTKEEIKAWVYALKDPETEIYFYVGETTNPLKRFLTHVQSSHNPEIIIYISKILERGLLPEMVILEETNAHFSKFKEKIWIKKFINEGYELLNRTCTGNKYTA